MKVLEEPFQKPVKLPRSVVQALHGGMVEELQLLDALTQQIEDGLE